MTERLSEKDLELLAWARAKASVPKKIRNIGLLGFAMIFFGGMLFINGKLYAFAIMAVGAIVIGVSLVMSSKYMKKAAQEVKDFAQGHGGMLPPWPDEKHEQS